MTAPKMQELWLNGKLVGKFPDAGDHEKNLAASQALMAALGFKPPEQNAAELAAYGQARSFAEAVRLIHGKGFSAHPYNPSLIAPLIVNAAFAVEVYLKAAGLSQRLELRGHEVSALFDQLPEPIKAQIQSSFDVASKAKKLPPGTVRDSLVGMNGAFVQWRYLYEKDQRLNFEVRVALALLEALDNVCRSLASAARSAPSEPPR